MKAVHFMKYTNVNKNYIFIKAVFKEPFNFQQNPLM